MVPELPAEGKSPSLVNIFPLRNQCSFGDFQWRMSYCYGNLTARMHFLTMTFSGYDGNTDQVDEFSCPRKYGKEEEQITPF